MKENISIIFAAIIGTFLIVILPLYSILDRQDSMSYNVVLTATTNFVDNIRNNGFIDKASYTDYISALASTANTYKVTIEAYKKTLVKETDEDGNVIEGSYVIEKELYNTQDILEVLENQNVENAEATNIKNNVYLFNEEDEIYVRVHNTNVTSGSIFYSLLSGAADSEVIKVNYGGIIKNINWELYNKIKVETEVRPEAIMAVPVNGNNDTNIQKLNDVDSDLYMACVSGNIEEYLSKLSQEELSNISIEYLCTDVLATGGENYAYVYDLSKPENQTIRIAIELRRFDTIDTGTLITGSTSTYTKLSELDENLFKDTNGVKSSVESYIIRNYVRLDGMYANVDLDFRQNNEYYFFDMLLTDVHMSSLDYISTKASVTILPGLGEDENGLESLLGESVEIEIIDENAVNTVMISAPHIWNKLLKTKSLTQSRVVDNMVYSKVDLAFVVSYTGINGRTDDEIAEAIKQNLIIYSTETMYSEFEVLTEAQAEEKYDIDIGTAIAGNVLIKFRYDTSNSTKHNYVRLPEGWIQTVIENVDDIETGESATLPAFGTQSPEYQVVVDASAPLEPSIALEGIEGKNGWYGSNVTVNLLPSSNDTILINGNVRVGGSGVDKNTIIFSGATETDEQEVKQYTIEEEGITYAVAKSYDYAGNVVTTDKQEIKIDKTNPTAPSIKLEGTEGNGNWYTSNVKLTITPGTDDISGIQKTTYTIEGSNSLAETEGLTYTLTKQGKSTIIATTYDNAGNKTETRVDVYIELTTPPEATITVISGEKHAQDNEWYYTDVTVGITISSGEDSVSGLGKASYKITGDSNVAVTDLTSTTQNITITQDGVHEITVYTYTQAGNVSTTKYTVKIDKSSPNAPSASLINGQTGANGWYTSNVELEITSNGDVGPSLENMMTYTITHNGTTTIEQEISNNGKIFFNEEGEHILKIYSRDNALNIVESQEVIKIDKTAPKSAEFIIEGTEGVDGWYISDVKLSYSGQQDAISGIDSVELSANSIKQNTKGTVVILTTKDKAGHSVTNEVTIKLDKSAPTDPVITITEEPTGSTGAFGTTAYNKDINITITAGVDTFLPEETNQDKTTYEVTKNSGTNVIIPETEGTSFAITEEGIITIIARTYDKAGNIAETRKVVWIDKTKPRTPKIISINGQNVEGTTTSQINSDSNVISMQVNNLADGNDIKIILINQATYETTEIEQKATSSKTVEVTLPKKGTYSIKIVQTNMFGTTSDESSGLYYYTYQ